MPSATFSYTGSLQNWTVPAGITKVQFKLWGAGGGAGTPGGWNLGSPGGPGGFTTALVDTTPGTIYYIVVGQGGAANGGGTYGGGAAATGNNSDNRYSGAGGGYSGIFTSTSLTQGNALLIAGGGGGGGSSRVTTQWGNFGGGGGGLIASDGGSFYDSKPQYRGRGGTQSAAGANATSDVPNIIPAQGALQGGTTRTTSYGGGGGGGYFGGSGGGYSEANTMAGGGGGSGYVRPGLLVGITTGSPTTVCTPPGFSTDSDLPATIGLGGAPNQNFNIQSGPINFWNVPNTSTTGGNGYVVINY